MPRPNPNRTLHSEVNLARRVAHEREQRGWTYEGMADRMTKAGCAIQPSAIYKIEKSDPPRRISVDELVGFSQVFDIPVERLLLPVEVAESQVLLDLFTRWEAASRAVAEARAVELAAADALREYVAKRDDLTPTLQKFVRVWVESRPVPPESAEAYWMYAFTRSEEWKQKMLNKMSDEGAAERKAKADG